MKDSLRFINKLFFLIFLISLTLQANDTLQLKIKDYNKQDMLHEAVRANNFTMIKYLIEQGIEINKRDNYGYTPLHLAVRLGQKDIASYLIKHNASVNTIDTYGDTPLIDSTRNKNTILSKLLICNGAIRDVADANGITTLENSIQNQEIVNLLRADNLKPYCQKEIIIDINPIKVTKNNSYSNTICGNITTGFATYIGVEFKNENDEIFGPFPAEFNNNTKKWCINTTNTTLKNDVYKIKITAKDNVPNKFTINKNKYIYAPKLDFIFEDVAETTNPSPIICGTSTSTAMKKLEVIIENKDKNLYGIFYGKLDNNKEKWCVNITNTLPHGYYDIHANITDLYGQSNKIIKKDYFVNTDPFIEKRIPQTSQNKNKTNIDIDNLTKNFTHKPQICGKTSVTDIVKGKITITDLQKYIKNISKLSINNIKKTWCTQITQRLDNGTYIINLELVNKENVKIKKTAQITVYTIPNLYTALNNEFKNDLDKWNAHIDKNDLTFSFQDKVFFKKDGTISEKYKKILTDFFPRYIKVTSTFQKDIDSITIKGDSSSKHVLSYLNQIVDKNIANNILWILQTFKSNAFSSSKLLYNKNNSENKNLFRKIEFKINHSTILK